MDTIQELSKKITESQALARELKLSLALRKHYGFSKEGKVVPKTTKPSGVAVGDYENYEVSITCGDKTVETTLKEFESIVGEMQQVRLQDKEILARSGRTLL